MGGAASRRKGLAFEQQIARQLRPLFPKAARHLEYQAQEAYGVDLVGTAPFKFQCKRLKKYASISTFKEIKYVWGQDIPVLITQGDREEAMAVLTLSDLIDLIRLIKKAENEATKDTVAPVPGHADW